MSSSREFDAPIDDWRLAPARLANGGQTFERCDDCFGIAGPPAELAARPPGEGPAGMLIAYRPLGDPNALPLLATGRIRVRFSKGIPPDLQADQLRDAGFRIQTISSHAPQLAVLTPLVPGPGASLARLPDLNRVPGAELVVAELIEAGAGG